MTDSKPAVPEVLPLVHAYRDLPGNAVGGSLHIVLDDGNVDDASVAWCRDYARENGDRPGVELAEILLRMSQTQRRKLAGMFYDRSDPNA